MPEIADQFADSADVDATAPHRIVLLAGPCPSTNIVYHSLVRAGLAPTLVLLESPVSPWDLLRRRAKKLGWLTVGGQLAFFLGPLPWLHRVGERRVREIRETHVLDASPIPAEFVQHVPTINTDEALAALKQAAPAVVMVNGTRIISRRILDAIPAPFINIHAGITPLFRGVHGGYWALATGHPERCGVTIHQIDAGIDTGGILAQALISPTRADNFTTYPELQLAAGLPHLHAAIRAALAGSLKFLPSPPGPSRLWSHPTLFQYFRHRWLAGVR